jgi:hypothetical protein
LPLALSDAELVGDPEKLKKIKKLKSVSWGAVKCQLKNKYNLPNRILH